MWIRLVERAPIFLTSEPFAVYVLEPGSLSRSNVAADSRNMLRVLGRYRRLTGWWHLRGWEAEVYRIWAAGHLSEREPRKALRPAWERLWRQPWVPRAWWAFVKSLAGSCFVPTRTGTSPGVSMS